MTPERTFVPVLHSSRSPMLPLRPRERVRRRGMDPHYRHERPLPASHLLQRTGSLHKETRYWHIAYTDFAGPDGLLCKNYSQWMVRCIIYRKEGLHNANHPADRPAHDVHSFYPCQIDSGASTWRTGSTVSEARPCERIAWRAGGPGSAGRAQFFVS